VDGRHVDGQRGQGASARVSAQLGRQRGGVGRVLARMSERADRAGEEEGEKGEGVGQLGGPGK
jgi:hypothetical protein